MCFVEAIKKDTALMEVFMTRMTVLVLRKTRVPIVLKDVPPGHEGLL